MGSEEFIAKIKTQYLGEGLGKPDREKPQLRKLREKPDLRRILCISEKNLGPGHRLVVPVAIMISHTRTALKLKEIGEFFDLSISGVANACSRARAAIADNTTLSRVVAAIEKEIATAEVEKT